MSTHIAGITTCVGELYASYLAQVIDAWADSLDFLTVVTDYDSMGSMPIINPRLAPKLCVYATSAFTRHGAYFNKGAALNVGRRWSAPKDWVLCFDCDIQPPVSWREFTEPCLKPGQLFGCRRRGVKKFEPFGYFQLWHASDDKGPYSEQYAHAGRYDVEYMERWPKQRWTELPFQVKHLGTPCKHWHGPGNEHLTRDLLRDGIAAYKRRDEKLAPF